MTRKTLIVLLATGFACNCGVADARQPNLILIMADDLGYETIAANGGESYKTPNLDRLAATGMRFERCYVQPLCTPTRVQLMTGMYNIRNYIEFGTMDPNSITFAHLLKKAGYATAIAGKWQLGRAKDLPQRLGFDEACLWQHTRRPPRYANPGLEYNGEERDFQNGEYGPDLVSNFALEFITRHKARPFFLYYPMMLTHGPFQPTPDSPDWDPKLNTEKGGRDVKHFADMVAYMDKLVGQLVSKLDELGIRENTLIMFIGDNGTGREITSRFKGQSYPGGKGATTARGMHVPLVANWPGRVPASRVNGDLVDCSDFLPTLCDAAGATVPSNLTIDGRSFLPQLLGKKGQPREWIYSWYSPDGGPNSREFAWTSEYKLYRGGKFFNLSDDPFEERPLRASDLKDAEAEAAKKLKAVMAQYADARPANLQKSADKPARKDRPGRAGRKRKRAAASKASAASRYPEHDDLSYVVRAGGKREPIRTPKDWQARRRHILAGIEEVMGPLPRPAEAVPVDVKVLEEHQEDGYVRRKVAYPTDRSNQRVRAWLLVPLPPGEGRGEGALSTAPKRRPAMLCLHQTNTRGKDSPVGLSDRPTLHYALELTKRGYVTLSPDYPSFGEYEYDFDADEYVSGSMKAIYDNLRAIDVLESLPEVDPDRIGCIGHSLGGHNSLFTAVFDERIKAVVTSCGFTSFHKYMAGDLHGWSGPRYMPLIGTRYNNSPDQMPFDFAEVIGAIAPRAVFVNAPLHDDNFDVEGVRDVLKAAQPIYELLGQADRLQAEHPDCAHDFSDVEREEAFTFLDKEL